MLVWWGLLDLDFLLVSSCMKKMFSPTQEQGFYLQLNFPLVSSCVKKICFLLPRNRGSAFSWIFHLFLHA